MEYVGIKEIDFESAIGNRVYAVFLAKEVSVGSQKNGKQFISITMKQQELEINAKLFDAKQDDIDSIKAGKVFAATIDVKAYDKSSTGWACVIVNGCVWEATNLSASQFFEWEAGVDRANEDILRYMALLQGTVYYNIVYKLVSDNWHKISYWAAAKSMHHSALGGLIVHTADVLRNCAAIAEQAVSEYGISFINMHLLVAGAIIHDIGKVYELNTIAETGLTEYTVNGSMLSHIIYGISMVDMCAVQLGIKNGADETEEVTLLKHMIASHHGKKEWGSPVEPSIPEAVILNKADELSATLYRFNKEFSGLAIGESHTAWLDGEMKSFYKDTSKK